MGWYLPLRHMDGYYQSKIQPQAKPETIFRYLFDSFLFLFCYHKICEPVHSIEKQRFIWVMILVAEAFKQECSCVWQDSSGFDTAWKGSEKADFPCAEGTKNMSWLCFIETSLGGGRGRQDSSTCKGACTFLCAIPRSLVELEGEN